MSEIIEKMLNLYDVNTLETLCDDNEFLEECRHLMIEESEVEPYDCANCNFNKEVLREPMITSRNIIAVEDYLLSIILHSVKKAQEIKNGKTQFIYILSVVSTIPDIISRGFTRIDAFAEMMISIHKYLSNEQINVIRSLLEE